MRKGFVPISPSNVLKGRRYDIDFGGSSFGLLKNREILTEPVMHGRILHFEFSDPVYGLFSQDIDVHPAYIREVG